jgi:hypothetical protein
MIAKINHHTSSYAKLTLSNGDPILISLAQSGILVKKTKFGILGAKLYEETNIFKAAMTAKALTVFFENCIAPKEIQNPVLREFVNGVMICQTAAEVTILLNGIVTKVEAIHDRPIAEIHVVPR